MDELKARLLKLPLAQVKQLVRSHNLHYVIKLNQKKETLVDKLLTFYNAINDQFTMATPSNNSPDLTILPPEPPKPRKARQPKKPKEILPVAEISERDIPYIIRPEDAEKMSQEDRYSILKHISKFQSSLGKIQNTVHELKSIKPPKIAGLAKKLLKHANKSKAIEEHIMTGDTQNKLGRLAKKLLTSSRKTKAVEDYTLEKDMKEGLKSARDKYIDHREDLIRNYKVLDSYFPKYGGINKSYDYEIADAIYKTLDAKQTLLNKYIDEGKQNTDIFKANRERFTKLMNHVYSGNKLNSNIGKDLTVAEQLSKAGNPIKKLENSQKAFSELLSKL